MTRRDKPTLAERLGKILESWKVIVVFLVAVGLAGVRFETWQTSLARAEALSETRAELARVSERTAIVEAAVADLKKDIRMITLQVVEIAKTVGARQIAPEAIP